MRSAYHSCTDMKKEVHGECSNRQAQKHVWEGIWRLNVPNSTKQFLWKALKCILPTKKNLVQKKLLHVQLIAWVKKQYNMCYGPIQLQVICGQKVKVAFRSETVRRGISFISE